MSNSTNDNLFRLVKSMTKAEKRYFKLTASPLHDIRGKKFVLLFDYMEKRKRYDERQFLLATPSVKPIQIHNLKAHLQKQILDSLRQYHARTSSDMKIRAQIDSALLLYNKGLYDLSLKVIDKAKRMAVSDDRSTLLLEIMDLEKMALMHTVSENNESRVNRIITETRSVVKSIQNISTFSNLAARLSSFYVKMGFVRDRHDHERVRRFFHSSLPRHSGKKLSFQENLYLCYSYVSYYSFVQDFGKSYIYARKWVALFEERPDMIRHKPELYLKGLNHLLAAENKLFLFREFEETYKKLLKVHSIKGLELTENIQIALFKYKYMHKINHYFMMGDFTGGTKIISVAENELDRFSERMDKHYILLFWYKVACLYFGAGSFRKAIAWLNRIINSRDVDLREDILSFARILNLIAHYELGNYDLVESHIKSTYRFLLKKEEHFLYHRLILRFLKNLGKETEGRGLIRKFVELKKQLLPLERHPYERRPFLYFDIISWLESKEKGKPVEEIIRARAKAKMKRG
ncbi:MAG: hypothetical protein AB1458_00905 [Bacteroidota bacterium]